MAEEYGDTTIRIKEELKPLLKIGKYLSIVKDLDSLEATANSWIDLMREYLSEVKKLRKENEKIVPYIEYVSKIKTASFSEKLKFLFTK